MVREANERGQVSHEFDLEGAINGMKADIVDETTNDARRPFAGVFLVEAIPKPLNLVNVITGDVGVKAYGVRRRRGEFGFDLICSPSAPSLLSGVNRTESV